eukprot:202862-Ditylum_brightwellii.AAC.1
MLDTTNTDEKKKIAAGKWNILAMAHLIMALGTELLFNKVNTMCGDSQPGRLAYKLIENSKEEYQPEDRVDAAEIKRKMSKVKMGKYHKLSKLINQIKTNKNQFSGLNKKMNEEDKIAL